jgi:DNA invertase Pin-like site-specific DNA recombinase
MTNPLRAAIYARVSTLDQEPENQLRELRRYVEARGWTGVEFVDRGVSGARDSRPALDALIRDARRRKFDVVVCWRLDRLGRSLKHLVLLLDELQALGVSFVSLGEGIDATTPAGRLQCTCSRPSPSPSVPGSSSGFGQAWPGPRPRAIE